MLTCNTRVVRGAQGYATLFPDRQLDEAKGAWRDCFDETAFEIALVIQALTQHSCHQGQSSSRNQGLEGFEISPFRFALRNLPRLAF
jgi:hypothetical protein